MSVANKSRSDITGKKSKKALRCGDATNYNIEMQNCSSQTVKAKLIWRRKQKKVNGKPSSKQSELTDKFLVQL